ncbi:MAG: lipocalin family protein [Flavobacteriales bacterium]|nr:lipocalin family protein [Flavobacteriales bacterium]
MKILKLFILVLAVAVSMTSCSKDEDSDGVSGNKYESTYAKITVIDDGIEQTFEYKTIEALKENYLYLKVDFRDDKTFWAYERGNEGEGDYEWMQVGTWTQKDNKVTISFEDMEGTETIVGTLDGNTLKLSLESDDLEAKKSLMRSTSSAKIEWHLSKL